jgi:hypothetical protein
LGYFLGESMQKLSLDNEQAKQLCDEVANALLNLLESQDAYSKIEATVSDFLKSHNIDADASNLASKLSWSVKVALNQ